MGGGGPSSGLGRAGPVGYYRISMGRSKRVADPGDIIEAAYDLIEREGYDNFSARRLAQDLGVSHMTLYNYLAFGEILDGVIERGFEELVWAIRPRIAAEVEEPRRPCALFRVIADELVEYAKRRPRLYRFVFQSGFGPTTGDPRIRRLYWSGVDLIGGLLDPVRQEELRRDGFLFLVLVNGLILAFLSGRHDMDEGACRRNIERGYALILGGFCGDLTTPGTGSPR